MSGPALFYVVLALGTLSVVVATVVVVYDWLTDRELVPPYRTDVKDRLSKLPK